MKKIILLTAIIIIAAVLRLYNIQHDPPSLQWDEVSIGYNAFSILKTGRDEHGRFMPYDTFVAYGDYKPPLAIYTAVPFVAVFGLTELGVRLPSALFGVATVLLTYFLVLELFRKRMDAARAEVLAFVTTGVLAISPWHVNLSRGGFEANIALFFGVLGVWCILKARESGRYWLWAWLPFVGAYYTFNSSRVFTVLLTPALLIFSLESVKKNIRTFAIGIIVALIAMAPIIPHLLSPQARLRYTEVNIFTDLSVVETANARLAREPGNIIAKLVNNRRVGYAWSFLIHFMDNLQPQFLFVTGDGNPKFSIQDVGELYLIEAPFLAIGIIAMFIGYPAVAALFLYWIIAAIVPAATARETPHALRILNSLPTWQLFVAFGFLTSIAYVKNHTPKKIIANGFMVLVIALYALSVVYYLHTYYVSYPVEYSGEWQYGYREALRDIAPIASKYTHIQITDSIGRSYMYTLFYTRTNPNDLFRTVTSYFDAAGFYHVDGFLNYTFGGKLPVTLDPHTLYVWDAGGVPKGARVLDTVNLLNGNPVISIFDSGNVKL